MFTKDDIRKLLNTLQSYMLHETTDAVDEYAISMGLIREETNDDDPRDFLDELMMDWVLAEEFVPFMIRQREQQDYEGTKIAYSALWELAELANTYNQSAGEMSEVAAWLAHHSQDFLQELLWYAPEKHISSGALMATHDATKTHFVFSASGAFFAPYDEK